jgi:hypothetical protein
MAKQVKDTGSLNSRSAIQATEDAEMRSAMGLPRRAGLWGQSSLAAN